MNSRSFTSVFVHFLTLILTTTLRLGQLFVLGPAPLAQDRSCISGQTCSLSGFQGRGLSLSDEIRVMDTCGVESAVPRAPQAGHFSQVSESGASVNWGRVAITAAGGQYRLCWRSGTIELNGPLAISTADTPSIEFAVDIGKLDILGPAPLEQERTCVSGQTCMLTGINGYELSNADRWRVLDTCGVPSAPYGIGTDLVVASGMNWVWESTLSTSGGEYRLCWCHGTTPNSAQRTGNITNSPNSNTSHVGNQSLESQNLRLVSFHWNIWCTFCIFLLDVCTVLQWTHLSPLWSPQSDETWMLIFSRLNTSNSTHFDLIVVLQWRLPQVYCWLLKRARRHALCFYSVFWMLLVLASNALVYIRFNLFSDNKQVST